VFRLAKRSRRKERDNNNGRRDIFNAGEEGSEHQQPRKKQQRKGVIDPSSANTSARYSDGSALASTVK